MEDQQIRINRETLEETVRGVTPGFPYMANLCRMNELPAGCFRGTGTGSGGLLYALGRDRVQRARRRADLRGGRGGLRQRQRAAHDARRRDKPSIQEEHLFLCRRSSAARPAAPSSRATCGRSCAAASSCSGSTKATPRSAGSWNGCARPTRPPRGRRRATSSSFGSRCPACGSRRIGRRGARGPRRRRRTARASSGCLRSSRRTAPSASVWPTSPARA